MHGFLFENVTVRKKKNILIKSFLFAFLETIISSYEYQFLDPSPILVTECQIRMTPRPRCDITFTQNN